MIPTPELLILNRTSGKMRVLHLITDLNPGGAQLALFKLLSGMDRNRFENEVVSMTDIGIIGKKIEKLGLNVQALGMQKGFPSWEGFITFYRLLKQKKPDILQTWLYHADLMGVLAGKRQQSIRIIWNLRCANMDFSQYPRLTQWVVRFCSWASSFPDAVIVNSKQGYRYHLGLGYHPKRWEVVPNGFDLQVFSRDIQAREAFRKELGLEEKDFLIGMIARFDPMKDHQTFLAAALELARNRPGVHFLLAGEGVTGENPFFSRVVQPDQLGGRLFLLGYRDDMASIFSALDLATSSSYGEGFPNVIGEAMASETPCVVTDAGDSAYLVADTGIVVTPQNPKALAEGWEVLMHLPPSKREELGRKARERISIFFNLPQITQRYEELYRELL